MVRTGPIFSRDWHAHGGITKLKFNYTAGRRTCAAERFPREFSLSLSLLLSPGKTSGKIASPVQGICRMIAGRRRRYGMTGTICRCRSFLRSPAKKIPIADFSFLSFLPSFPPFHRNILVLDSRK